MAKRKAGGVPMIATDSVTTDHRSMDVHPSQVAEANETQAARHAGVHFRPDGKLVASRSQMKRYITEINKRAADRGEARLVNYDGGYGDPT